jgi:hypothetical protein
MCPDHEHALVRTQMLERVRQRRDAAGTGRPELLGPTEAGGAKPQHRETCERASHY